MIDLSGVRMSGPLEPFAPRFAADLSRQGYVQGSACQQMQLFAHLSRWLAVEGLMPDALTPSVFERFLEARRAAGYKNYLRVRPTGPLLRCLRDAGVASPLPVVEVPEGPVEVMLSHYLHYLTVERGLSPKYAKACVRLIRPFLESRLSREGLELERLSGREVIAFVVEYCRQQGPGAAKDMPSALRSLLGFLHLEGELERSLVGVVPSIARWQSASLPKRLESWEVRALLASCDRHTASGRRSLAVLTVLWRLGLRVGEVAALQLDDIDWRAGEIVVRGKGSREDRLPLPADVGERIATYLRDGRPESATGRTVFVQVNAPHGPLGSSGVRGLVTAAGQRAGLVGIHAHRLRHTAASEMLGAGASLTEIGQVLRHRWTKTTAIYAKVDRKALRTIARCWPAEGGEA